MGSGVARRFGQERSAVSHTAAQARKDAEMKDAAKTFLKKLQQQPGDPKFLT
jgi:hypothetical protein